MDLLKKLLNKDKKPEEPEKEKQSVSVNKDVIFALKKKSVDVGFQEKEDYQYFEREFSRKRGTGETLGNLGSIWNIEGIEWELTDTSADYSHPDLITVKQRWARKSQWEKAHKIKYRNTSKDAAK